MNAADNNDAARALQRVRLVGLSALAFVLMLSYALARPPVESLFLERHGSSALPIVALMVALGQALVVWGYTHLLYRFSLMRLLAGGAALSGVGFALLALAIRFDLPFSRYALYLLKDLYIVALVEIFYTYSNSVFPIRVARWAYGFFGMLGAAAGFIGHLVVGRVAVAWSTERALSLMLPVMLVAAGVALTLGRVAGVGESLADPKGAKSTPGLRRAIEVLRESSYLLKVMLLVGLVQVVITFVDFDFNRVVNDLFKDVDLRTRAIGDVYAFVSAGTLMLHALTGPTLRTLGIPLTLLFIPLLLGSSVAAYVIFPIWSLAAAMKVASKVFDYTLFRAAKEMLYIPLDFRERTQGKAIVDMFTYRVAKGGAALLMLGLIELHAARYASHTTLPMLVAWFGLTLVIVKRFRQKVGRDEEMGGG